MRFIRLLSLATAVLEVFLLLVGVTYTPVLITAVALIALLGVPSVTLAVSSLPFLSV